MLPADKPRPDHSRSIVECEAGGKTRVPSLSDLGHIRVLVTPFRAAP